jgi:hypothetical protein
MVMPVGFPVLLASRFYFNMRYRALWLKLPARLHLKAPLLQSVFAVRWTTRTPVVLYLETDMRFRIVIAMLLAAAVIAGCQGPPPTLVYIVVTATPEGGAATTEAAAAQTATNAETLASSTELAAAPTATSQPPSATPAPETSDTPTAPPTNTQPPTTVPTDLPANFPTPWIAQIPVAEQLFEHGRMFWVGPIKQIWVLKITNEGHGTWEIYSDDFKDGEPENDPSIVPPDGRYQPQRGFGKLWRESPGLREALGWGVTPEFGYASRYEYHAGGSVDASGKYTPGPGYHILFSLGGEEFRFSEADSTWELGNG